MAKMIVVYDKNDTEENKKEIQETYELLKNFLLDNETSTNKKCAEIIPNIRCIDTSEIEIEEMCKMLEHYSKKIKGIPKTMYQARKITILLHMVVLLRSLKGNDYPW